MLIIEGPLQDLLVAIRPAIARLDVGFAD